MSDNILWPTFTNRLCYITRSTVLKGRRFQIQKRCVTLANNRKRTTVYTFDRVSANNKSNCTQALTKKTDDIGDRSDKPYPVSLAIERI
jgi:hypothetical protein